MTKRIKNVLAAVVALSALALGGAVFAQAQSGRATMKATAGHHKARHAKHHATRASSQQAAGEQTGASEQPGAENSEQSGESAGGSDGPGGHADEAGGGNANADHQFQGEE
jgi:hypothetical protein